MHHTNAIQTISHPQNSSIQKHALAPNAARAYSKSADAIKCFVWSAKLALAGQQERLKLDLFTILIISNGDGQQAVRQLLPVLFSAELIKVI
jgi:hypothetical protein